LAEKKIIYLTFVSGDDTPPDIYTGNLEIKTNKQTKNIQIIDNIESKKSLFDVRVEIPKKIPGINLWRRAYVSGKFN